MALFRLRRLGEKQMREHGVSRRLLIPDLPSDLLRGDLDRAIMLANLWRLRRRRANVVGCIHDYSGLPAEDLQYALSLPRVEVSEREGPELLRNLGVDDIAMFLPNCEEDFLLFLPKPAVAVLPAWPLMVTQLDGVLIGRCDEFVTIEYADPQLDQILADIPEWHAGRSSFRE
jgi:hypothetical protein